MTSYLITEDDKIYSDQTNEILINGIPTGNYTANCDSITNSVVLSPFKVNSDTLIDMPDGNYNLLLKEMTTFFTSKVKNKFDEFGFIYKKAILLHGKPGTGKTCLVVRLLDMFNKQYNNSIALFNPKLDSLQVIYKHVKDETPMLIIFEEFDSICNKYNESYLLSLLDGQIQRPNTVYLFTTNFIDKIPCRLFRPSRLSNLIEIKEPSLQSRIKYLQAKLVNESSEVINDWAQKTKGFTLDDLKSLILSVKCLDISFNKCVQNLKESKVYLNKEEDYNDNEQNVLENIKELINGN